MRTLSKRFWAFAGLLLLLISWEQLAPLRPAQTPVARRRARHLALAGLNSLLIAGLYHKRPQQTKGPLQRLPGWLAGLLGWLALDLAIYWQHRCSHRWPWLWQLHRWHHQDSELEATSGVNFHPLEALFSMGYKLFWVRLLGIPARALLFFELLLNLSATFNHANIRLPHKLEKGLRPWLITPTLHLLHHSVEPEQQLQNFGFSVPWWDQLFGSYAELTSQAARQLQLGLTADAKLNHTESHF